MKYKALGFLISLSAYSFLSAFILSSGYFFSFANNNASVSIDSSKYSEFPATPCVALLLSSSDEDMHNVQLAIRSFDKHIQDNLTTPFLIFQEGDMSAEQQQNLRDASTREITFPFVNLSMYPTGFEGESETNNLFRKRSKFGYQQMCRFWISRIWTHEALREINCKTVMRMDADSCFWEDMDVSDALPRLNSEEEVYRANVIRNEKGVYIEGLWDLTQQYVKDNNLVPRNTELWSRANETFQQTGSLPYVYNNFEIAKVSFFLREDVMDYQKRVAEEEPFGVFRRRWGDAVVRYLTLALFADRTEIDLNVPSSYGHGRPRRMNRGCPGLRRVSPS